MYFSDVSSAPLPINFMLQLGSSLCMRGVYYHEEIYMTLRTCILVWDCIVLGTTYTRRMCLKNGKGIISAYTPASFRPTAQMMDSRHFTAYYLNWLKGMCVNTRMRLWKQDSVNASIWELMNECVNVNLLMYLCANMSTALTGFSAKGCILSICEITRVVNEQLQRCGEGCM